MGVTGLWKILQPAGEVRSLTDLAVRDGFLANPDKKRGFRLGIDASIWFFHAEYGKEGENPVLRTLFFRCARLTQTTFLPLFVFDGPKRPDFKRGKKVSKVANKLIPGMKRIVEAFGFECRTAPGEAEAELAYLNNIGVIDGVMSDDVDNFLFGATTVIRNISNNLSGNKSNPILNSDGKDDKNHTRVYTAHNIMTHPDIQLTRGGSILIGLMSGGDYNTAGVPACGIQTAHALARCGFGDSLFKAAQTLSREALDDYIVSWREELIQELNTNSRGIIGRKLKAIASKVPHDFPDVEILLSYVRPVTSQSMGRESNNLLLTWGKEPDLAKLAGACELFFEWGYKEAILKRFRTVVWPGIVLRILRRAVLDQEERERRAVLMPGTPSRKGRKENVSGTPSKMIAQRFSSMTVTSPVKKSYLSDSEDDEEEEENKLIVAIHSKRENPYTDHTLEYRLEIAPKQLVELAESGIQGVRSPEGPDEWDDDEAGLGDGEGGSKKKNMEPVDPVTHFRVWMPACMVELVEPKLARDFVQREEEKEAKKIKAAERKAAREAGITLPPVPRKPKAKAQPTGKAKGKKGVPEDKTLDIFYQPPPSPVKKAKTTKESILALFDDVYQNSAQEEEEESDDDDVLPSLATLAAKPKSAAPKPPSRKTTSATSPPAGIRDLTKKKATDTSADLLAFFASTKATTSRSTSQGHQSTESTSLFTSTYVHATSSTSSSRPPAASSSSHKDGLFSISRPTQQLSSSTRDLDDGTWEEYDPQLWSKTTVSAGSFSYQASSTITRPVSPVENAILKSPSKRSARNSSPGWSSDESLRTKFSKSPRKSLQQSSPRPAKRNEVRDVSPSPMRRAPYKAASLGSAPSSVASRAGSAGRKAATTVEPRLAKRIEDVIELTDSDDEFPKRVMPSKDVPPLLAARAMRNIASKANATTAFKVTKPKKAPIVCKDVIELSD
ncbi:hypothetical protein BJ165DRAFT_1522823 [Panaeolus papilionaceus]|nr:hypothetical protein BJ165DRAFT_1522823 [Panaeolus papilionaceus]